MKKLIAILLLAATLPALADDRRQGKPVASAPAPEPGSPSNSGGGGGSGAAIALGLAAIIGLVIVLHRNHDNTPQATLEPEAEPKTGAVGVQVRANW